MRTGEEGGGLRVGRGREGESGEGREREGGREWAGRGRVERGRKGARAGVSQVSFES